MIHKESLSYDKTDPISIYEYALPLIDHTLREIVGDANAPSSTILQYVFPTQKFLTLLCPKMDEQQNLIVCRTAYGKAELLPPRSKPSAITLLTS